MKRIIFLFGLLVIIGSAAYAAGGDTIVTKSGLKYVRTKAGDGKHPAPGDKVSVYYTGTLPDGTVFDTNRDVTNTIFKFTIGQREVIPGWEEGFQLMSKGEKGILFIPANLGYGSKGVRDDQNKSKYIIPPNSPLIFEVEVVNVK